MPSVELTEERLPLKVGNTSRETISLAVRVLLQEVAPGPCLGRALSDDLQLGREGLGLDSVSIVDLFLRCEDEFAIPFLEELLADGALTVGRLVTEISERLRAGRPGESG